MLRKLRRLNKFAPAELFILLQLVALASAARLALTFLRLSRVIEFVAWGANNRLLLRLPMFQNRYRTTRLTYLADIAACTTRAGGPCLLRALLIFWLLKTRGEHAELLIGIHKEASALNSHAWIESRGMVIGDSTGVTRRFATLVRW